MKHKHPFSIIASCKTSDQLAVAKRWCSRWAMSCASTVFNLDTFAYEIYYTALMAEVRSLLVKKRLEILKANTKKVDAGL